MKKKIKTTIITIITSSLLVNCSVKEVEKSISKTEYSYRDFKRQLNSVKSLQRKASNVERRIEKLFSNYGDDKDKWSGSQLQELARLESDLSSIYLNLKNLVK